MSVRETVLQSLSAVGAQQEATFYADLFARQEAESFALLVIDPRCLKDPLLEALISALRILSSLRLTPILVVGATSDDRTSVKFQAQRLSRDLDRSGVRNAKLNTGTYGLIAEVRKLARAGMMPVLEMSDRRGKMSLGALTTALQPGKIIFLQPSGGLNEAGVRREMLTIEALPEFMEQETFSAGQVRFLDTVLELDRAAQSEGATRRSYVIASPLNLLGELFTTRGTGTLIRRGIDIVQGRSFDAYDRDRLAQAVESAFDRRLVPDFFKQPLERGFVDRDYRAGALFTQRDGYAYLSKFFVLREARGEGIARDIWDAACREMPSFIWRSRLANPFSNWYMRQCDGMQLAGPWRVFWRGLDADQVPGAIRAVADAPDDFVETN